MKKYTITDTLLQVGKSPITGRIYPRDEVLKVIENFQTRTEVWATSESTYPLDLSKVVGRVISLELVSNSLVATVEVLDTPMGRIVKQLMDAKVTLQLLPTGVGMLDEDCVVTEYKLDQVIVNLEPARPRSY